MPTQQTTRGSQQSAGKNKPGSNQKMQARKPAASPGRTGQSGSETSDSVYGVVSVLYHALQGADTYEKYIEDARASGDDELMSFFEQCHEEENRRAARAKSLLASRLERADDDDEDEDEDEDDEDEDEDDEDEE